MSSAVVLLSSLQLSLSLGILLIGALLVQGFGVLQPLLSGCLELHPGIAGLASQASYWADALWDSLSGLWMATHC